MGESDQFELDSQQLQNSLAVDVIIRRFDSYTAGTPEVGIPRSPIFKDYHELAYVHEITPQDAFGSDGFYQHGDLILGFERPDAYPDLKGYVAETDQEADRVIYEGLEYRVMGQPMQGPIGPDQLLFRIHIRKLGLAIGAA